MIIILTPDLEDYNNIGVGHDIGDNNNNNRYTNNLLINNNRSAGSLNSNGDLDIIIDKSGLFISDKSWVLGDDEDIELSPI